MRSTLSVACAVLAVAAIVACVGIVDAQNTPAPTAPSGPYRWNSPLPNNVVPTEILSLNATHVLVLANGGYYVSRALGTAMLLPLVLISMPTGAVVLPQFDIVVFCGTGQYLSGTYVTAVTISTGAFVWSGNGTNSLGCSQIQYSAATGVVVVTTDNFPLLFDPMNGSPIQLPVFQNSPQPFVLNAAGTTLYAIAGAAGGGDDLSAVDVASGKQLWIVSVLAGAPLAVFSAADSGVPGGVVVVASVWVYSAANGTFLWQTNGLSSGNDIYFSSGVAIKMQNGFAYAFDGVHGTLLWTRTTEPVTFLGGQGGLAFFSSFTAAFEGVYVAALNIRTGEERWAVPGVTCGMAVIANNALYVFASQYGGDGQTGVLALSAAHGKMLDFWATPAGTPVIYHVSQSSVYIAGGNTLAAFALVK